MFFEKYCLFEANKYFKQCHAAFITEMPNHSLWVSFFGGTREKAMDVGSWFVKKKSGDSQGWTEPKLFLKVPDRSHGGCHFFVSPEKTEIWAFYNIMQLKGRLAGWSSCNTARHIYRDHHWEERDYIRKMIGWNTRGKVLVMDNGDYLFPMHDELLGYKAYFRISKDKGRTWKNFGPVKTPKGCLEPTVVQLADGRLLCHLRTKEREIYESWSLDRGRSWTKAVSIGLPNPDSMVDLLVLPSGRIVLAYNHSNRHRDPLNVAFSNDNGKIWEGSKVIEQNGNEFSYPCLIYGSDGMIHLTYTHNRTSVGYARFDEEWLVHTE